MPAYHDPEAYETKRPYPHRVTFPVGLFWLDIKECKDWLSEQPGRLGRYSVCTVMDGRTQFQFELEKTAILFKLRFL